MFFDDSVAAFANMATALRRDGRLCFSAWGAIDQNPFFTLPAQVARQIIGPVPRSDPDGPGPFAFRDVTRVEGILLAAGLDARTDVVEETLHMPDGPLALAQTMCRIGPAHMALTHHNAEPAQKELLLEALVARLEPFSDADGTRLPAQINYVTATKST